ncbi:MAG: Lipoate-protein ligase LplJ [Candidatus Omnitrophica bacterium]|nr:Lipoate-protein ligase LplJ [Candidatus Omnitrophota bacterium]
MNPMKNIDLSFNRPEDNLAFDEALLDLCEEGSLGETLRFWEADRPFIVAGYSNKLPSEVNLTRCREHGVPVLRRVSGGGTVLQAPGCLNYALILRTDRGSDYTSVTRANAAIMEVHRGALERLIGKPVSVRGFTDLVTGGRKFSGNAQRRKRRALLFHGTFLYGMDLGAVETYLPMPTLRPEYRADRPHGEFIANLDVTRQALCRGLIAAWDALGTLTPAETRQAVERSASLVEHRYARPDWVERA